MTTAFKNKVVLVTGASRGIGKAVALAFARQGATLVLAARSSERLQAVHHEILDLGGQAIWVATDVTSTSDVDALLDTAMQRFGRIYVLVSDAWVGKGSAIEPVELEEDLRSPLQASLFGAIHLTRQVLP